MSLTTVREGDEDHSEGPGEDIPVVSRYSPLRPLYDRFRANKWAWTIGLVNAVAITVFFIVSGIGNRMLGDFISTWVSAEYAHSGYNKLIFQQNNIMQTLPGMVWLLQPVVFVVDKIPALSQVHALSKGAIVSPPFYKLAVPYIFVWLILPLCAVNAWIRRWDFSKIKTVALLVAFMVLLDGEIIPLGHPEDALALGCVLYALLAARNDKFKQAGWWIAFGACLQLIAVLVVPIILIMAGRDRWFQFLIRAAILPGAMFAYYMAISPYYAWHAMTDQIVWSTVNKTPTFALTTHGHPAYTRGLGGVTLKYINKHTASAHYLRSAVELFAVFIAVAYRKTWKTMNDHKFLWLVGLIYIARVTGSVVFSYYLVPGIVILLLSGAALANRQLVVSTMAAAAVFMVASQNIDGSVWRWMILLVVTAILAYSVRLYDTMEAERPPPLQQTGHN